MITEFDDFCLWMYVIVDDIWRETAPLFKRPGPAPICSDSELITMALIGECRGCRVRSGTQSTRFDKSSRQSMGNCPSNSISRSIVPIRSGGYALGCTPNWQPIHCVSTSTACWASPASYRSKLLPFPSSIRPY